MPVITPQFEITIKRNADGKVYRVPAVQKIEIKTARDNADTGGDKAVIVLPTIDGLTLDTFRENDQVTIKLGHKENNTLEPVFYGRISSIGPRLPVEITAHDLWSVIRKSRRSTSIDYKGKTLSYIATDLIANAADKSLFEDVELLTVSGAAGDTIIEGHFYVDRQDYGQLFNRLVKFGWDLFFVPGTKKLYFGPRNQLYIDLLRQTRTPIFRKGLNIISSKLSYKRESEVKQVKLYWADSEEFKERTQLLAVYPSSPNDTGEVIERVIPGLEKDSTKAKTRAEEIYREETSRSGYSGEIRTFGRGDFVHPMKCFLELGDGHDGHYFPKAVDYRFSVMDGFKMDVKFDKAETAAE